MANLLSRIVDPRYPASAIGLEKGVVSVVNVDRGRGNACAIRRAATFDIADSLIHPSFDSSNIEDIAQLADVLRQLVASAGLMRQKRWSIAIPEASARTLVLTLESPPQSNAELQEVLKWKIERGFGADLHELSVAKERLQKDSQGRDRYLTIAVRREVLAEYEATFASLRWRAGLILPRHMGEAQWLIKDGAAGDGLLLSGSDHGFTAVIFRGKHPLIMRTVSCAPEECEDELYRVLLFYRDRRADGEEGTTNLSRLMVVGKGLPKDRVGEIVNETTGGSLRVLDAVDFGLQLPPGDLKFDRIAAPAGLATLSW